MTNVHFKNYDKSTSTLLHSMITSLLTSGNLRLDYGLNAINTNKKKELITTY
jgi:hypothetical protein